MGLTSNRFAIRLAITLPHIYAIRKPFLARFRPRSGADGGMDKGTTKGRAGSRGSLAFVFKGLEGVWRARSVSASVRVPEPPYQVMILKALVRCFL